MERKNGPWTIKKTIQKYKNPWIEVKEDQVIRPDGKPGIFGIVNMKAGYLFCLLMITALYTSLMNFIMLLRKIALKL